MYTAATWFHRFYMRYAMEDYHRQVRRFSPGRSQRVTVRAPLVGCCVGVHLLGDEDGRVRPQVARRGQGLLRQIVEEEGGRHPRQRQRKDRFIAAVSLLTVSS